MRNGLKKALSLLLMLAFLVCLLPFNAHQARAATSISRADWILMLTDAYEALSGELIDDSIVDETITSSSQLRKGLVLGIVRRQDVPWMHEPLDNAQALNDIINWYAEVMQDLYATSTQIATIGQAIDMTSMAYRLSGLTTSHDKVLSAIPASLILTPDALLTNQKYAQLLVSVYEEFQETIAINNELWTPLPDTDDVTANKAASLGIIPMLTDTGRFEPTKQLQHRELWEILRRALPYHNRNAEITLQQAKRILTQCMLSFMGKTAIQKLETKVLNERSYDWYVNQLETGSYSNSNCMPACAEMVLKWYDGRSIPAELLRTEHPGDDAGWYDDELFNVLTEYGLPLSRGAIFLEKVLDDLDKGNIIIAMHSFGKSKFGHAVVIKGYTKTAAGTWFIVNDPYSPELGIDNKPQGNGILYEAREMIWAMSRASDVYFRVSPKN